MKELIKPIRVILADDHTLVRAGIRALLEKLPGVQVVGEAGDGREVLNLVKLHQPDVVLMDISLGEKTTGIDLIRYMQDNNILHDAPFLRTFLNFSEYNFKIIF